MVVDRGGLRYPIEVIDLFSANLQKFRTELRASRTEFANFRAQGKLQSQARKAEQSEEARVFQTTRQRRQRRVRQLKKQKLVEARIARERAKAETEELRRLDDGFKKRKAVETLRAQSLRSEQRAAAKVTAVQQRVARATKTAATARARASKQQEAASKRAANAQARLNKRLKVTDNSAQQLLFTFRRLVGVLALFTIARQVTQGFTALVKAGFEFNQTLERSRLGIAGIITAVAKVTDAQGKQLKGAEAFLAAQVAARRQQQLLRQDALNTTATFQELLDAFQIALGPGLAAGFNLDQVRQFSVLISQAASNIGLPQRQLSEEIRAILTGNIRQTTTRIAQVLNLTNKEIRKMKALGADVFFESLRERLQGFALGAQSAAQTVGGLLVRLKDVTELVSGAAAKGAFETLRGILKDLFGALTVTEKTKVGDLLRPDPQAQKAFEAIFFAIERILTRIATLGKAIGIEGLTTAANVLATTLEIAAGFVVGIVEGISSIASLIGAVIRPLAEFVGGAKSLSVSMTEVAQIMGQILALTTATNLASGLWVSTLGRAGAAAKTVAAATAAADIAAKSSRVSFLRIGLILGGLGLAFQQVFRAITGLDITFSDTLEIIRLTFAEVFGIVTRRLTIEFKAFGNALVGIFTDPLTEIGLLIQNLLINPIIGFASLLAKLPGFLGGGIAEDLRQSLEGFVAAFEQALGEREKAREPIFNLEKDKADLDTFLAESFQKIVALRTKIILRGVVGEGFDVDFKINGDEPTVATEKIAVAFTALTTILSSTISQFAQTVGDAIVDAFDPTKDAPSIKERFARLMQSIAKIIITQLIQLAIVKALLNFGVPAAGLPGVSVGRRKGGRIPGRGSQASLAHYTHGQGMAAGGAATPPKGISRKDTTPIWAQPGEYMMRLSAVQKYGLARMEAINNGIIDPGALDAMAGSRRLSHNTRRKVGYATGGQVAAEARTATTTAGPAASVGGGGGLGAALLIANETTAERLLAGGSKAVLDFIDEHGADIEGRLSRFRS